MSSIHRAKWVVSDSSTIYHNGFVKVEDGLIKEIGKWPKSYSGNFVDHGSGAITPLMVNTHTHLELTALKGKVCCEKGFSRWVKSLIYKREALGEKSLAYSANEGIKELTKSGCGAVGDISSFDSVWKVLSNSNLYGVWFKEYLGNTLPEDIKCNIKKGRLVTSLSGHAPHTTAPELIFTLKKTANKYNLPFSIHLAESYDEIEFLLTGKGRWADLLTERGIDFSRWKIPVKSPVSYLEQLKILDKRTIAVHLLFVQNKDFEILSRTKTSVCICPRSNYNLHKRLPDLEKMIKSGIKPSLGTDSLASVQSLNMFNEMAFTSSVFPSVPPETIFDMATINGAAALGLDEKLGSLRPGKYGSFVYVPIDTSGKTDVINALVNADFNNHNFLCN